MMPWLNRRPVLASFITGVLVAVALMLLAAERWHDRSAGGSAQSYYSQF